MFAYILFPLMRDKNLEAQMSEGDKKYVEETVKFAGAFMLAAFAVGILVGVHYGKTGKFI